MSKTRINTDGAIQWAQGIIDRLRATQGGAQDLIWSDADIQEYNLAHGITVDGLYQDQVHDDEPAWWKFW